MLPNLDLVGRVHQHALLAEGFADRVVILHHQPQFRTGESLADTHVERRDESRESHPVLVTSVTRELSPKSTLSSTSAMAVFKLL